MTTENIVVLTNKNFDECFLKHNLLVIDFWAPWCEPCKDFSRIFSAVALDFPDFCFGSINIDEEKELATDFQIKSIPTLAIFRNKIMVFHQSGTLPKGALVDLLKQAKEIPEDYFVGKNE